MMAFRVFVLLLTLCASATARAQEPVPAAQAPRSSPPVVVATGQATVRLPPDRAYLMLSTETRALRPAEAQQRNAKAMGAVQQKLEAAGLSKDSVRTVSYTLDEEFEYGPNRRTSKGFHAVNTIEVRIDDISRVGEILDLAVGAGATSAGNIRFDVKDRAGAERQALRLAVADARMRAEAAAAGANTAIVAVIRIEEQGAVVPPPRPVVMMRAAAAEAQPETPVNPGEIEIEARVQLTATIK
jgi:uncharacterized protein YggE